MTALPERDTGLEPELEPGCPTPRPARRRGSRPVAAAVARPLLAAAVGAALLGLGMAGVRAGWLGLGWAWLGLAASGTPVLSWAWAAGVAKPRRERALVQRGKVARAVVTAAQEGPSFTALAHRGRTVLRWKRRLAYGIEYRFRTAGGEVVSGRAEVGAKRFLRLPAGSRVTVLYDPTAPGRRHVLYPLSDHVARRSGSGRDDG